MLVPQASVILVLAVWRVHAAVIADVQSATWTELQTAARDLKAATDASAEAVAAAERSSKNAQGDLKAAEIAFSHWKGIEEANYGWDWGLAKLGELAVQVRNAAKLFKEALNGLSNEADERLSPLTEDLLEITLVYQQINLSLHEHQVLLADPEYAEARKRLDIAQEQFDCYEGLPDIFEAALEARLGDEEDATRKISAYQNLIAQRAFLEDDNNWDQLGDVLARSDQPLTEPQQSAAIAAVDHYFQDDQEQHDQMVAELKSSTPGVSHGVKIVEALASLLRLDPDDLNQKLAMEEDRLATLTADEDTIGSIANARLSLSEAQQRKNQTLESLNRAEKETQAQIDRADRLEEDLFSLIYDEDQLYDQAEEHAAAVAGILETSPELHLAHKLFVQNRDWFEEFYDLMINEELIDEYPNLAAKLAEAKRGVLEAQSKVEEAETGALKTAREALAAAKEQEQPLAQEISRRISSTAALDALRAA